MPFCEKAVAWTSSKLSRCTPEANGGRSPLTAGLEAHRLGYVHRAKGKAPEMCNRYGRWTRPTHSSKPFPDRSEGSFR